MTVVIEALDNDLDGLLNFSEELKCDYPPCERAAKWSVTLACCGQVLLMCQPCYEDFTEFMSVDSQDPRVFAFICNFCKTVVDINSYVKSIDRI